MDAEQRKFCDQMLCNQAEITRNLAVVATKLDNVIKVQDKQTTELESLKRFKWGVIGTAAVTVSTLIKSIFS